MATRALQQVVSYLAWNTSTNAYVTGDSANHTTYWTKDGTASATTNATGEVDATHFPGLYKVTMTSTETDCIEGVLGGKSSTSNVVLIPTMVAFDYLNTSAPAAAGIPDVNVKNIAGTASAGAAGSVAVDATVALTESYRAFGAAPTLAQALFEIIAHLINSNISGTTKTLTKLDRATTAKTGTLDSATAPTKITEAS